MKPAKDYIVFPLDVPTMDEARHWVALLDGYVGMFKIGLELFISQGPQVVQMVRSQSRAGVFLDLKLCDISQTVARAMGVVSALGVDLVTVHCSSTKKMLASAVAGGGGRTGVLGVTLLTDNDSQSVAHAGFKDVYSRDPAQLVMKRAAMAHEAGCAGVVCSGLEAESIKADFGPGFLAVTPGIRPAFSMVDTDDQKRVVTPADAIRAGSDLLVIGRPIRSANDPRSAAIQVAGEIDSARSGQA